MIKKAEIAPSTVNFQQRSMQFRDRKMSWCSTNCLYKNRMNVNSYLSVKNLYLNWNIRLNLKAESIKILKEKIE